MATTILCDDSASRARELKLVFVYGSLKRGMANHQQIAGSPFAGTAVLQGLALFDLGPFPMAIVSGNPDHLLHGELYGIDDRQLEALDRFEGTPRLYARLQWSTTGGQQVWVYVGRPQQVRFVKQLDDGQWRGRGCDRWPSSTRCAHQCGAECLDTG